MRLSACSIVKNEANNIARSIESYREVVDEIIIVDTGSTDNTVEICEKLGAKVLHFEWINDFAAAKNFALEHAKGDWVIFLDADEWFVPKLNDDRIFKVLNKVEKIQDVGIIKTTLCNIDENTGFISTRNSCARIIKNGPDVHYEGKIHEDIRKAGSPVKSVTLEELEIYHCGYSRGKVTAKSKRNLEMLYDIYRKGKADTATYYYLCRENVILNNYNEGLKFYDLFFEQKDCEQLIKSANIFVNIYEYGILIKQNRKDIFTYKDVFETACTTVEKYPDIPIHTYLLAVHYFNIDYSKALPLLKKAIALHKSYKGPYIDSFAYSLPDAYFKIAQIYRAQHMLDKAFDYYVLSLKELKIQTGPFNELLQLIRSESDKDIIQFLNSLYDIDNKEHVGFLAKQLMNSRLHKVFLYYAVKYNKEFDGQDETTYIAMILSGNEELAVETAMTAYFNAGKEEDRFFAALAILCKKRTDLYEKYRSTLNTAFSSVINRYFRGEKLIYLTKDEIQAFLQLYRYMFYIGSPEDVENLDNSFIEMPLEISAGIVECYVAYKDNTKTIEKVQQFLESRKSEQFNAQMYKMLGFACYLDKKYADSLENFQSALESKHINIDRNIIVYLKLMSELGLNEVISFKALKLYEKYAPVFEEYVAAADMVRTGKLENITSDKASDVIKKLSEETFQEMIKPETVKLPEIALSVFFNLSEKYLEKDMDVCAHNIIIKLMKNEYKKDILYYRLGEIYSRLGNPEMSLYSHSMAFEENATFAETLIPDKKNINHDYIYKNVKTNKQECCPLCGGKSRLHSAYNAVANPDFLQEYPPIKVWRYCDDCCHLFAADILEDISFEMEDEKIDNAVKSFATDLLKYEDSVRELRPLAIGNKLLDIGCGSGQFIAVAIEYGFEPVGVEPIEKLALLSSRSLGVSVYSGSFESFESRVGYDVISMGCVLECFINPKEAVKKVYDLLNSEGIIYMETPNLKSGYARILKDKNQILHSGRIWNYFSRQSLYKLLEGSGFEIVSYRMSKRNNGYMEVCARKRDAQ